MASSATCYSAQVSQGPLLNFDRVEYGEARSLSQCSFCGRAIDELRFEVLGRAACSICVQRVAEQLPANDRRTFLRSTGVGLVASVAASLSYMLLLHVLPESAEWTAMVLAAMGIGWVIGKAMRWAAHDAGGRRYQWTATFFAYAAVVYSLQAILLGYSGTPWWAIPFILLSPVAFLFTAMRSIGALEICAAFVAIRWAWLMLRKPYNPIRQVLQDGSNRQ